MKVGFILECAPNGPEKQICQWLAKKTCPNFELHDAQFKTMVNKRYLMEGCGEQARLLLDAGCHHVFIVWDLRPAWPNGEDSDCVRETAMVHAELKKAKIHKGKATCVCITQELETWLLADAAALQRLCRRGSKRIPQLRNVEEINWPKNRVEALLRERRKQYAPHYDAITILQDADEKKLRKVQSYRRLEDRLKALC